MTGTFVRINRLLSIYLNYHNFHFCPIYCTGGLILYMVKRDPDDLITALSKNLKTDKSSVLRFTFKRGGLWRSEFAKAHSRKAKVIIRDQLKAESAQE